MCYFFVTLNMAMRVEPQLMVPSKFPLNLRTLPFVVVSSQPGPLVILTPFGTRFLMAKGPSLHLWINLLGSLGA